MTIIKIIAGIDEAGRGALAGPVYAAAVVLDPKKKIKGLADSKKLSAKQREALSIEIKEKAFAYCISFATASEIDEINILQASLLAMQRAVAGLGHQPTLALVDGREAPRLKCEVKTIIDGDQLEPAISAASILAKVARDKVMCDLDLQFPQYEFASHKGYGTEKHLAALVTHGVCAEHRRSYAPVRNILYPFNETADEIW